MKLGVIALFTGGGPLDGDVVGMGLIPHRYLYTPVLCAPSGLTAVNPPIPDTVDRLPVHVYRLVAWKGRRAIYTYKGQE